MISIKVFRNINLNYIINFFLFVFILSIPFKNFLYQFSSISIICIFIYIIKKEKDFMKIKRIFLLYKDIFILFILLILSMFISTLLNFHNIEQLGFIIKYFFRYGVIFFILIYFYEKNFFTLKNLGYYIVISFLIVAFNGYHEYFFNYNLYSNEIIRSRLEGGMFNPNTFGLYMSLAAIFFTILYFRKSDNIKIQIIYFFTIGFFLFLILHSGSRSAWLMYGVFFIIYNIEIFKKTNKFKILLILFIIFITILTIIYFDKGLINRFNSLINLDPSQRDIIWKGILPHIFEKPFLGYGVNSFEYIVNSKIASAHNSILEILLYTGIFGFCIFTFIIYKTIKEIIINKLDYIGVSVSFIIVLIFDHSIFTNKIFLSVMIIFCFFIYKERLKIYKDKF